MFMPTLEGRVATLEARIDTYAMTTGDTKVVLVGLQDQMNRRFEQVDRRFEQMDRRFEHVDQRFVALQDQMNQRFDAVDGKIDRHFTWLVGIQVAVLVAVVGALVAPYYR
jgi:hypothetical protein